MSSCDRIRRLWIVPTVLGMACGAATASAPPTVLKSIPANGAGEVNPSIVEIVITFDSAMKPDSYSVVQAAGGSMPEVAEAEPFGFRDDKTFVMRVKLAPNTAYAVGLNSATRQGFRSVDGTALAPMVIRFRTGSGGSELARLARDLEAQGKSSPQAGKASGQTKGRETPISGPLPAGWVLMDDKLFGTQVAVPPGWTPRVRGEVALCVEPDEVAKAGAFFIPLRLGGKARCADLADGFDAMLRRGLPSLQTRTVGSPTPDSVQRELATQISGTAVAGSYRAVVSRYGTGFVMGYLAPTDHVERLQPTFYRILASYRYTGPRMRLQPFTSAAVELRVPPGWQVQTSEGRDGADQDIDWQVECPQVPGARAFMFTPKFFSPNWIADALTGQVDPQLLALWQNKGMQMANIASDQQALQMGLEAVMPGLQIVRQQSLDEVRDIFEKLLSVAIQTVQATGGRMNIYAFELLGRRQVQGVEMRSVILLGMGTLIVQGGIKGPAGIWNVNVRGFEAPATSFGQVAPMLDRVATSFNYTPWWIKTVMKANDEQARIIRQTQAEMNRIDKEIFDNRVQTHSAINEMMYDTLTENYGYVNEKTGTIEKVPAEHLEKFRKEGGYIGSPEDVIDRHIPLRDATTLREAGADDYMSFDRRVQVWP